MFSIRKPHKMLSLKMMCVFLFVLVEGDGFNFTLKCFFDVMFVEITVQFLWFT